MPSFLSRSRLSGPLNSTTVSSIADIKTAAADNGLDEVVVANGTYSIVNATSELSTSLFFGSAFASRTRPVTIRAATDGGVTFDGGGASMCGLFVGVGATLMGWRGFQFANVNPVSTGVVTIGRHISGADEAAPSWLTFRQITVLGTCLGANSPGNYTDHAFYVSSAALPGAHDILFEDATVVAPADTTRYLHSAIHAFGDENATDTTPWNVTVRRLTYTVKSGTLISGANIHDWTFEYLLGTDCTVFGARQNYDNTNMVYRNCTTTGSGVQGFYNGGTAVPDTAKPPSATWHTCSFA